ncbi:hypothetical protein [Novosphingobium terrae]|uniref:hypothetical protein n=1 Tax=Novosphingobium terrae TaxID=2726189 RepID=UPI00197F3624|nr:hypothetical protein [Novosphingobium terrae]
MHVTRRGWKAKWVGVIPFTLLAVIALSGCASTLPESHARQIAVPHSGQALLLPAGDGHLFLTLPDPDADKNAPGASGDRPVVYCSEPAPDFASSLSLQHALSGGVALPNGTSANATVSAAAASTIVELAGRSSGVLALRDGLYNACLAYASGLITRTHYTLILSQYGDLMVSLIAAGSSASSSSSSSGSNQPVTVAVAGSGSTTASTGSASTKSSSGGSGAVAAATDTIKTSSSDSGAVNEKALHYANGHLLALMTICLTSYDRNSPLDAGKMQAQDDPLKAACKALLKADSDPAMPMAGLFSKDHVLFSDAVPISQAKKAASVAVKKKRQPAVKVKPKRTGSPT